MARNEKELVAAFRDMFDEVWTAVEQQVRDRVCVPCNVPAALREQVQSSFVRQHNVEKYDPRRASDRHLLAKALLPDALLVAQALAMTVIETVANLDGQTLRKLRRTGKQKGERRSYQTEEASARNRELLTFVAERAISLRRILSGKGDLRPGRRGPAVRTPWDAICEEWNRTHCYKYKSGKTLARAHYRAAETSLSRDYYERVRAALMPEELRELLGIDETGTEEFLDSVFLRFEAARGERFAEDARQFVERAQALRRANEADGICQATREANEEKADALEQAAQALMRVSEVKEWVVVGGSALQQGRHRRSEDGPANDAG